MAKFRVWAQCITDCYIDIEADTEKEAIEAAREVDGSDFHEDGGDWVISEDVYTISNDNDVDYTYDEIMYP